ncbi:MAG: aminotransferase [Synergistales bacterium]|nr:aminotransferase [Synergistales bacterium]
MDIQQFGVEKWMNTYENEAIFNLGETCVDSFTLGELLDITGKREEILQNMVATRLSYGDIQGSQALREQIAGLYQSGRANNVLVMNGGAAANFLALYSLVKAGDRVISVHPTYQQLYSIPESFGATVDPLRLRPEEGFHPNLQELEEMCSGGVDVICCNNPNNPTGALMSASEVERLVDIAGKHDAWLVCDEVYRHLYQEGQQLPPSVADLYEKGVSTGSMSKVFSLAGIRIGWVAGSERFIENAYDHRDYTTISVGRLDDMLASLALEHREAILERNLGIIRNNLGLLDEWVAGEERIDYVRPEAGTTALLHYDYDIPSDQFGKRLLDTTGTFVVPGGRFDMEHWIRVGYAFESRQLQEGLQGLSSFLRTLDGEGIAPAGDLRKG